MKSKKTGKKIEKEKADVRYIVVSGRDYDDMNASVFETLDGVRVHFEDALDDDDMSQEEVEGIEVMEVHVKKIHRLNIYKKFEVTISGDE